MQGVPDRFDDGFDAAQFRQAAHRPGVELYRAHIVHHSFEPHTHEAYGLGAIESGVERFRYRGSDHLAPPDSLVLMNPDVLHTGHAATAEGWRYRMIYVDPEAAADITGDDGWWFDEAVRHDPARARRVTARLDALWHAREPLEFDGQLHALLEEFRDHAKMPRRARSEAPKRFAPVLECLRARLSERVTLEELAAVADLSPFHFLRQFRAQYHVTPQQMLMALRLHQAKRLLAAGLPSARIAADTRLTDQAHLTRAFQRRYGVTPARYQKQIRG